MKRICIIGDSWAGNVPYSHGIFSRLFEPAGFSVTNLSAGGASNQGQLKRLENELSRQNLEVDCVVWIYTEPARDFTEFVSLDYGDDAKAHQTIYPKLSLTKFYEDLIYMCDCDLQHAARLCDMYSIKFIVIGGAGQLPRDVLPSQHVHIMCHSWNQEICGLQVMPWNCYPHHVVKMADFSRYDREQVLNELENIFHLETFMKNNRDLYADGMHPSLHLYPSLAKRIISYLQETQS